MKSSSPLPNVRHGGGCYGLLRVVQLEDDFSRLICDECGAILLRKAKTEEVTQILVLLAMDDGKCRATCPHCGAINTFTGLKVVHAYICRDCGEGVTVKKTIH